MGVTGLWTVLQPCARPIKIETLNKKRLAVDASIWIYQFLKAVRDKEGNALRNSHIVGFFRRICKLLFFGIKPVFVFDGGAPALKRQTISNRRSRREGRREDAARTAGKLLAIQMQRAAEEEERKRKEAARQPRAEPEEEIPENVVYAEEILQTPQERLQNRKFKKTDQYHLPDLGVPLSEMGGQNDPRIMSLEELEEYARQFDIGEDINVYDFSKIDFDSPFFVSLPASDRYNILNAARLRSRLRMGYSKDQLDTMFPDRMAFSRFQIERVRERNELTQRLMNINGMADDNMFGANGANRIAGERAREYVLVKNDGVEGGWALGVVSNKEEGKADKPIDVDRVPPPQIDDEEWEDDDEFEDVPIEGLNRLPKPKPAMTAQEREGRDFVAQELSKRRKKFYQSRRRRSPQSRASRAGPVVQDPDSLFFAEEEQSEEAEWEDALNGETEELFEEPGDKEEDEQLQRAIAMSLGQGAAGDEPKASESDEEDDAYREVFQQERVVETAPFSSGSGLAIARQANQRSNKATVRGPFGGSDSEEDDMDLQAALVESRRSKRASPPVRVKRKSPSKTLPAAQPAAPKIPKASGFSGPLPFESLNLGNSILGKKKMQKIEDDTAGGFERDLGTENKKSAEPLPPWFENERDIRQELSEQRTQEKEDWEQARKDNEDQFQFQELPRLRKEGTQEVIDVDAPPTQEKAGEVITIDSDREDEEMADVVEGPRAGIANIDGEPAKPQEFESSPSKKDGTVPETNEATKSQSDEELVEWSESEPETEQRRAQTNRVNGNKNEAVAEISQSAPSEVPDVLMGAAQKSATSPAGSPSPEFENVPINNTQPSKSPSPEFEDVPLDTQHHAPRRQPSPFELQGAEDLTVPVVPPSEPGQDDPPVDVPDDDSDQYSDPEDAELFASLAAEAEEHARFAQELNSNTARINFEEELKQLRAQQKKDRRDADEVTQTVIAECQHLLTLFGLPYITAPMEAEAQCAELVRLGLVDGIVTDDSDTFLFGGTRIYKNMFNAAKFVECYLATDLTTEFSLTREKLIDIAQLLGSDYTPGIPGIGPVTALEILSEFDNLQNFKDWWSGVQEGRIPKEADQKSPFRRRFRRSHATKLFLPTNFPDPRVAEAYLEPDVDSDPQPFQWGVPDLDALRTFLSSQIGWSWERTDEVLVPVIRDMNRREKEGTQSNITRFFEGGVGAGAFAPRVRDAGGAPGSGGMLGRRKGRLGAALTRLAEREKGTRSEAEIPGDGNGEGLAAQDIEAQGAEKHGTKRRGGRTVVEDGVEDGETGAADDDEEYTEPRKKARRTRKKKN
ncbi:PIN domain-like protein [Westerdykella ornata]|uniref:PIN domain-like protein n=1 Tax=Westerdykella ornata TaxID=318751 RepID=A0A6A6JBX4_WESOR|nr:PIN domain-like protein [Westerdykella ornata]KAF2273714.1 PIN domain-like protein [Westerdykella ornata]